MNVGEELASIAASEYFVQARAQGCKLSDDTRDLQAGDLFVLRRGASPIGPEIAAKLCAQAHAAGARAVIGERDLCSGAALPFLPLSRPHLHLNALAEAFWGDPSREMQVIAVTGTNGKTTTTYLIESVARAMGLKVGVLGTISHRYPGYEEASANTTPGTLKLRRLLRQMADAGCRIAAMEVSSHGIMQGRIDGVLFDAAIWTNLGTDHLDFHKTREAYGLAKRRLFDTYLARSFEGGKSPAAAGNAADAEVMRLLRSANPECWGGRMVPFAVSDGAAAPQADVWLSPGAWTGDRQTFCAHAAGRAFEGSLPLVGTYNLANAAGALAALVALGYDAARVVGALRHADQIPGRMECVHRRPLVIVDFAHTPEALRNALTAARGCVPDGGRLICVFGAGGDRDPSKRPTMGKISLEIADFSIVTSDNPRTEPPGGIIDQIVSGMTDGGFSARHAQHGYIAEIDRKKAIDRALESARDNDVVVIAGKGHEDYQIIGTEKHHFDDREAVRAFYVASEQK